jgi:hypothetical protein
MEEEEKKERLSGRADDVWESLRLGDIYKYICIRDERPPTMMQQMT